jgi:phospholipid transport system transporter-binding protein
VTTAALVSSLGDGRYRVEGDITIDGIGAVLARPVALAGAPGAAASVDLSGLSDFDSAALGVLLEWKRQAARSGTRVVYVNLPAKLLSLARLYGVAELLDAAA